MIFRFRHASLTNRGGREKNEDYTACSVLKGCGCYVVADGLGGHFGGELAAKRACDGVLEAFQGSPGAGAGPLAGYLEHAGRRMDQLQAGLGRQNAAKTTLVVLLVSRKRAAWAHVGDSRLYFFSGGSLCFQTRDHSIPQRLADIGEISPEEIRVHEDKNCLLAVFDSSDTSRFTLHAEETALRRKDAFLLCSDGFWEYVFEAEMERDLRIAKGPQDWLNRMEARLRQRVGGKNDNYTALAVIAS